MKIAIITGDLVESSQYSTEQRHEAIETLKQTLNSVNNEEEENRVQYELYRGDSVQILVQDIEKALTIAILLRAALRKLSADKEASLGGGAKTFADIRLSIGIGEAEQQGTSIVESDGEAYRLSGRTLDGMKKNGQKLIIRTSNTDVNEEFEVACRFLDVLMEKWSVSSAEVVFWLLKSLKDVEIAGKLGISQPAIHSRKKVAGWEAIELMLKRFQSVMSKKL